MIRRLRWAAALAAVTLTLPLHAQSTRPWLEWRTIRTEHFDVHYPTELEAWTRDVVSRLEGVRSVVAATVGSAPRRRVTVVVDNPAGEANGSAFSFLRTPYILLYPTPPEARSTLGHTRSFVEQLLVHEFVHIAHLTRPSRNPLRRFVSFVDPRGVGPLAEAPRWIKEGYATYVEGRLTGSGRPHGVIRAAVLRQWAIEGRLPAYSQLSAESGPYQASGMAYLAGSAFLEWLAERQGEESLVLLWRRMSARQGRSFDAAFAGIYDGTPQEMYGFFTVDVTAHALEARRRLTEAGLVPGDMVQRLSGSTGDPAVSPDGRHVALTLRGSSAALTRVVVWRTEESAANSAEEAARRRLLQRDPEDVPAVRGHPRPRTPAATLLPEAGLAYESPRFLPSGQTMLVLRAAPIGGGATRQDLYEWNWRANTLRRVTHGAGIRAADPSPDGRRAVAVQCRDGFCGLVMVDLRDGSLTPLAAGNVDVVFDRPRFSPDGARIAAAMQQGGRWRLVVIDTAGGPPLVVHDDPRGSAYDPVWTADGTALIATSEAGGIANLARIDLRTGESTPLTRVTGAAGAPEVDRETGEVWFLSLHAGGQNLHRIHPDSVRPGPLTVLTPALAPAVPLAAAVAPDTIPRGPVPAARPYGVGPRWTRALPLGTAYADGGTAGVIVYNADPVGRLALAAQGVWGDPGLERGASLAAVWRGMRPALTAEAFYLDHAPSRLAAYDRAGRDARYAGASLAARNTWSAGRRVQEWRLGASAGRLDLTDADAGARVLGFGRWYATDGRRTGPGYAAGVLSVSGAAGSTLGESWARGMVTTAFGAGWGALGLRAEASMGRVSGGAPRWERWTVGGPATPLVDEAVVSQRVAMPALRWGALEGEELLAYRISTNVGFLTPYFWGGSTDPSWERWLRMAGVELATTVPGFRAAASPGIRMLAGVAYGLDGGYDKDITAYFGIGYVP
jgi:Fe2+ transport system protein FeoA